MQTKHIITIILCMVGTTFLSAAETILISIDGNATPHKISRYIYGKNNSTNDDSTKATTDSMWTLINESGIGILRENSGNNLTKYNFHRRVASHPDWYNRVQCNYIILAEICQTWIYKTVDKRRKKEYNISMVKTTCEQVISDRKTRSCSSEFFRVLLSVRIISV